MRDGSSAEGEREEHQHLMIGNLMLQHEGNQGGGKRGDETRQTDAATEDAAAAAVAAQDLAVRSFPLVPLLSMKPLRSHTLSLPLSISQAALDVGCKMAGKERERKPVSRRQSKRCKRLPREIMFNYCLSLACSLACNLLSFSEPHACLPCHVNFVGYN